MCCLVLLASGLGPRIVLAGWWIFGDKVDAVWSSWVWPLLGLLLLPWTTLFYVIVWSVVGGVSGAEWLLVALGVVLDIGTYGARSAKSRYGQTVSVVWGLVHVAVTATAAVAAPLLVRRREPVRLTRRRRRNGALRQKA